MKKITPKSKVNPKYNPHKVLVVEDDTQLREMLVYMLKKNRYHAVGVANSEDALEYVENSDVDLILLDFYLPRMNGDELGLKLKTNKQTENIIIVMLTGRVEESYIAESLFRYADDYITKPFSNNVLLAKIFAQLRNKGKVIDSEPGEPKEIIINNMVINISSRHVHIDMRRVELTKNEFDILLLLVEKKEQAVSKRDIHALLDDISFSRKSVDNYISHLRTKLADARIEIETLRGFGVRFTALN